MPRLEYPDTDDDGNVVNDSQFHDVESGEYIDPGQTVDVPEDRADEFLNHDFATFERASDESESADVDAQADTGRATDAAEQAPFDPDDHTIPALREELNRRDLSDEELDALEDAERSDPDPRSGALDAIDDQREG